MNLTIDTGNTRTKYAVFDGGTILATGIMDNTQQYLSLLEQYPIKAVISSSVGQAIDFQDTTPKTINFYTLNSKLPLQILLDYDTPSTLGPDRIAAAVGATIIFPEQNCLVIDAGTCITIDLVDEYGAYCGGAIMPGFSMKFNALHTFTEKLPLLHLSDSAELPETTGKTTDESILSGVVNGTLFEIEGFVNHYNSEYKDLQIAITGGDAQLLSELLKDKLRHTVSKDLTLIGLNKILEYNEKQNI